MYFAFSKIQTFNGHCKCLDIWWIATFSTECGVHPISRLRKNAFFRRRAYDGCLCQDSSSSGTDICRLRLVLFSSCLSVLLFQIKGYAVGALCIPPPHCNFGNWWNFRVEIPGMSPDIQTSNPLCFVSTPWSQHCLQSAQGGHPAIRGTK